MENTPINSLVSEISRNLISEVAPQELPLFRATSEAYFKNPDKVLTAKSGNDDILGFGTGEAMILLTPVALAITTKVINFLIEEVKRSAKEESANLVSETVKAFFKKFRQEKEEGNKIPPLSSEQLTRVQEIAIKEARRLKLSEKNVKLLANAIVGSLAVAR